MPRIAVCLALLVFVSSASAQVFYEPVNYQHDAQGTTYYYGGSSPSVHANAKQPFSAGGTWGRVNGHAFASGDVRVHREVVSEPTRVYTDATGLSNAHLYGFTPADARNEAYANAPRYFKKSDLLKSAVRKDGAWHVPATSASTSVHVYKSSGERVDGKPTTMPRPLMIIPKDQLQPARPNPEPSNKQVAKAE